MLDLAGISTIPQNSCANSMKQQWGKPFLKEASMDELLTVELGYLEMIAADPRSELHKRIKSQSEPVLEGKYINITYEFEDGAVIVHSELDFELAKQGRAKYYVEHIYSLIHLPYPNPRNLLLGIIYQDQYPYLPWELRRGL